VPGLSILIAENSALSHDGWLLFLKGTWVGMAVTAPPGPVSGLAVRRTARDGLGAGLVTALGALLADVCLGAIAMLPSSQFRGVDPPWEQVIGVVVAVALVWLGVRYFRRALRGQTWDQAAPEARKGPGLLGLTAGTFALTLMTPGTVPAFLVFFSSLHLGETAAETHFGPGLVIAGVAAGASAWWVSLCGVVHRLRGHAQRAERALEFVCAGLLFAGAAFALWRAFR
jgi:threonine/homoserine/homoserine lactone efflux protein